MQKNQSPKYAVKSSNKLPISPVRVFPVGSSADLESFIKFGEIPYNNDPFRIPVKREKLKIELLRSDLGMSRQFFLAIRGSSVVARCAVFLSTHHTGEDGSPVGLIGYFEALDDAEAALQLLSRCSDYLKGIGATQIIGPMNGDTWHSYRLNAGPFDSPPFLLEPYNPKYYSTLWEQAGFKALESYHSKVVSDLPSLATEYEKSYSEALASGITFRPLSKRDFQSELAIIHSLTCRIFDRNFLYSDISVKDFINLYADAKPLIDENLIWFASSPSGEPCGFAFALPDFSRAIRSMRGSQSLWAKVRFLMKKRTDSVNIKTLGVQKEFRKFGTPGALIYLVYKHAVESGFKVGNLCLIKDGNPSGRYDAGTGHVSRRYILYTKKLDE